QDDFDFVVPGMNTGHGKSASEEYLTVRQTNVHKLAGSAFARTGIRSKCKGKVSVFQVSVFD
ncbi:MAG: hypothetical protein AB1744_09290, partial [Candidatus Zixiibacteriota bacterium]